MGQAIFSHNGHCPICETAVAFVSENTWFRDHLLCTHCLSVPRERAVMHVIAQLRPDWRNLRIHESSPSDRATSRKLRQQAPGYIGTQYFPDVAGGEVDPATGMRCENLSAQTFADESFDLVVTQDVFEHIPEPAAALREIARTLRPGGFHVASVPLVRKWQPTQIRARLKEGAIEHILPPEYHGNPISDAGSLVTTDWGYDFAAFCQRESGMDTIIQQIDNIDLGIRAEFIEIVVSHKAAAAA